MVCIADTLKGLEKNNNLENTNFFPERKCKDEKEQATLEILRPRHRHRRCFKRSKTVLEKPDD